MKERIPIMALLAVCAAGVVWLAVTLDDTQRTIEDVRAVQRIERSDQIVHLPEDADGYHVSVLLHDDWRSRPKERELVAWFAAEPALVSLKAQTHYRRFTTSDPIFQDHFGAMANELPVVLVQDGEGYVEFKASRRTLPSRPRPFANLISKVFRKPDPCPEPGPCPDPAPGPEPDVAPVIKDTVVLPDTVSEDTEEAGFPFGLAALAAALAGGGGLAWNIRKEGAGGAL